ncbi:MAG: isoprenyl transferase [Flavobacteriales bacterium]|nr:isoprenyl transferase [Flavobacteriales bacterium]
MNYTIDKENLPQHIAIIMDGNGRWAKAKGKMRAVGHENGAKSLKKVVECSSRIGIKYLTAYSFSTENWNRPKLEVDFLMKIMLRTLKKEFKTFMDNDVRLNAIGDLSKLPDNFRNELYRVMEATKNNKRMMFTLALNYGSRHEICRAVQQISDKVKNNLISVDAIDDSVINEHLYTNEMPDVDLLIRTSGECRVSNYLLWQIAYAELYFTEKLWPDFKEDELIEAIESYQKRERRFGKTSEQVK